MLQLYRAPFSTNVERVALALAHKGLSVESVVIDYADRSPVFAVSGQALVPVLVDGSHVIADSAAILRYLEEKVPDPPLFPREPAARAEMDVFIEWFNEVWKVPPNAIEAELGREHPDELVLKAYELELRLSLDLFERLLAGREFLFGAFSAADCIAFPFVKYALLYDEADDELFHRILDEYQSVDARPRLADWIERVDARPRV